METIEKNILAWIELQHIWQRNLFKRIVRKEPIDTQYLTATARSIIDKKTSLEDLPLTLDELSSSEDAVSTVSLLSIGELKNINALMGDQTLTFGQEGITIIYGDNGCGKSGYARIAKQAVGARHQEEVLKDVFKPSDTPQSAKILSSVNGIDQESLWPSDLETTLKQIHFYDEACGDDYIEKNTQLKYRPSVLRTLDQLATHVDELKTIVSSLREENEKQALPLPQVPPGSPASQFLGNLSESTAPEEIDTAVQHSQDLGEARAALIQEESRLKTTNPSQEKQRLLQEAKKIELFISHLGQLRLKLSPKNGNKLLELQRDSQNLEKAASDLSQSSFEDAPLQGIGNTTWRALWQAAENFSTAEAYPEEEFPVVADDKVCVLCQQPLSTTAQDRLRRFHQFVHNDVSQRARKATHDYKTEQEIVEQLLIVPESIQATQKIVNAHDEAAAKEISVFLAKAENAKNRILEKILIGSNAPWEELPSIDIQRLQNIVQDKEQQAEAVDESEFRKRLSECQKDLASVEGKIAITRSRTEIEAEIERLKKLAEIKRVHGSISTGTISTYSGRLSRTYVTQAVKDRFVIEAKNLNLDHVVFGDQGTTKGKISHRPALAGGAKDAPQKVLSEGEQTAAGLAGFFTEVHFDPTKSAVIFDDPMSSLDHERREKAARRVVEIAKDRQVIVFTHDLVFLGEIMRAGGERQVKITERAILRANGTRTPGMISEGYPWKAKDAKRRIGKLREELGRIKRTQHEISPNQYERITSDWAGKLSETWERIIRSEVAFKLVDRGTTEVRPRMFRIVEKITTEDNTDFQAGYSSTSRWARRHDKSEEVSHIPPTPDEMEIELERISSWWERVKNYEK